MPVAAPTWATARQHVRPHMPLTGQAMEIFRLANNERREVFRTAAAPLLTWRQDLYPNYDGADIHASVTKPHFPIGNIQSHMITGTASGNIAAEFQSSQTYVLKASDSTYRDAYWSHWLCYYYTLIGSEPGLDAVWCLREPNVDWQNRGRIYGLAETDTGYETRGDHINFWQGQAGWLNEVYANSETDWQGNSPPTYGKERPRAHSPITSRLFTETWWLLNRLYMLAWALENFVGSTTAGSMDYFSAYQQADSDASQATAENTAESDYVASVYITGSNTHPRIAMAFGETGYYLSNSGGYYARIGGNSTDPIAVTCRVPSIETIHGNLAYYHVQRPMWYAWHSVGYNIQATSYHLRIHGKTSKPPVASAQALLDGSATSNQFAAGIGNLATGTPQLASANCMRPASSLPADTTWLTIFARIEFRDTDIPDPYPEPAAYCWWTPTWFGWHGSGGSGEINTPSHPVVLEWNFDHLDQAANEP